MLFSFESKIGDLSRSRSKEFALPAEDCRLVSHGGYSSRWQPGLQRNRWPRKKVTMVLLFPPYTSFSNSLERRLVKWNLHRVLRAIRWKHSRWTCLTATYGHSYQSGIPSGMTSLRMKRMMAGPCMLNSCMNSQFFKSQLKSKLLVWRNSHGLRTLRGSSRRVLGRNKCRY